MCRVPVLCRFLAPKASVRPPGRRRVSARSERVRGQGRGGQGREDVWHEASRQQGGPHVQRCVTDVATERVLLGLRTGGAGAGRLRPQGGRVPGASSSSESLDSALQGLREGGHTLFIGRVTGCHG